MRETPITGLPLSLFHHIPFPYKSAHMDKARKIASFEFRQE
jgi:hypothetical protein